MRNRKIRKRRSSSTKRRRSGTTKKRRFSQKRVTFRPKPKKRLSRKKEVYVERHKYPDLHYTESSPDNWPKRREREKKWKKEANKFWSGGQNCIRGFPSNYCTREYPCYVEEDDETYCYVPEGNSRILYTGPNFREPAAEPYYPEYSSFSDPVWSAPKPRPKLETLQDLVDFEEMFGSDDIFDFEY